MANVETIAQSSKRLEAMSFGVADYAASTRARTTVIGGVNRDSGVLTDKDAEGKREYFWTDPWHAAQTRMLVACRAYGLRPIDGPFGDFNDPDGFRPPQTVRPCSAMRVNGRSTRLRSPCATRSIHPSAAEVTKATRIMEAMAQAAREGRGAVSLDGRLIDYASIRMAEALLKKAQAMSAQAS